MSQTYMLLFLPYMALRRHYVAPIDCLNFFVGSEISRDQVF